MKKNILTIVNIFILGVLGCNQNNTRCENELTNVIDTENRSEFIKFSNIFSETDFIKLETTDDCFISYVDKMVVKENRIYILSNNKILIFDFKGKFIDKIDKFGKGPGEYIKLTDFIVDNKYNIKVLDRIRGKILIFNDKNELVYEIINDKLAFSQSFTQVNNDVYAVFGDAAWGNKHRLIMIDIYDNKIINQELKIDKSYRSYQHVLGFSNFINDSLDTYVSHAFTNIIYKINPKSYKLTPIYSIKYKNPVPSGFYEEKYSDIRDFNERAINYDYFVSEFIKNKDFIYFNFRVPSTKIRRYSVFYFFNSNKSYISDTFIDDIVSNSKFNTNEEFCVYSTFKNNLFYVIEPVSFLKKFKKSSDNNGKLKNILNNTTDTDNPILLVAKLRINKDE